MLKLKENEIEVTDLISDSFSCIQGISFALLAAGYGDISALENAQNAEILEREYMAKTKKFFNEAEKLQASFQEKQKILSVLRKTGINLVLDATEINSKIDYINTILGYVQFLYDEASDDRRKYFGTVFDMIKVCLNEMAGIINLTKVPEYVALVKINSLNLV